MKDVSRELEGEAFATTAQPWMTNTNRNGMTSYQAWGVSPTLNADGWASGLASFVAGPRILANGQLGLSDQADRYSFERVGAGAFGGARVVAAAAAWEHSAAVTEDGQLWTWGKNEKGQLGQGEHAPLSCYVPRCVDTKHLSKLMSTEELLREYAIPMVNLVAFFTVLLLIIFPFRGSFPDDIDRPEKQINTVDKIVNSNKFKHL